MGVGAGAGDSEPRGHMNADAQLEKSIKPSFELFNKRSVFCNIFKMKSKVFMNFLARSADSKQFPMVPRCPSARDKKTSD